MKKSLLLSLVVLISNIGLSQVQFQAFVVTKNPDKSIMSPQKLQLVDMNADGKKDLVVSNKASEILCFYNMGNTQYSDPVLLLKGIDIPAFYVADFDQDGDMDIAVTQRKDRLWKATWNIFINDGNNHFSLNQPSNPYEANTYIDYDYGDPALQGHVLPKYTYFDNFKLYDFNADGSLDLYTGENYCELGNSYNNHSFFNLPKGKIFGDIDSDGDEDLIVLWDDSLKWIENNNGFSNIQVNQIHVIDSIHYNNEDLLYNVELVDLDNDNDLDIMISYRDYTSYDYKIKWLENDGNGQFGTEHYLTDNNFYGFVINDFNLDGKPDILAIGFYEQRLYFNNGNNNFTYQIQALGPIRQINLTDINNDNYADLVFLKGSNNIYYAINNHQGFDTPVKLLEDGNILNSLVVKDTNHDTIPDIYAGFTAYSKLSRFTNIKNHPVEEILIDTLFVNQIIIDDFNQDNQAELMLVNTFENIVHFDIINNQLSHTNDISSSMYGFYGENLYTTTGDLNNDGHTDFIIGNTYDLMGYFNDGQNNFTEYDLTPMLTCYNDYRDFVDPKIVDLEQNNENGFTFINGRQFIHSFYEYQNSEFYGVGIITHHYKLYDTDNDSQLNLIGVGDDGLCLKNNWDSNNTLILSPVAYSNLQLADMDNDGDIDIIVTAPKKPALSWFENAGNGVFEVQHIIDNSISAFDDLTIIDYDNDGDNDIFATNKYNGQLVYFENRLYVGIEAVNPKQFKIYPNPANNLLYINNLTDINIKKISIVNMPGQRLKSFETDFTKKPVLDISGLSSGIYNLILETDNNKYQQKFIKK